MLRCSKTSPSNGGKPTCRGYLRDANKSPVVNLDWETRLNIACDATAGLQVRLRSVSNCASIRLPVLCQADAYARIIRDTRTVLRTHAILGAGLLSSNLLIDSGSPSGGPD